MKITVHSLVKNEERYVWYSVTSVIDYVDKILLWDTGSTDNTPNILKKLKNKYSHKIDLRFLDSVTAKEFPMIRQKMLDETESDWILIVDGDEIWWEGSISRLIKIINNNKNLEMIVSKNINPVGDIYNVLPNSEGKYNIDGKKGFLNIRAINLKVKGLHVEGEHGVQGYYDSKNRLIQTRRTKKKFTKGFDYLHMTNLKRSSGIVKEKDVPKRQKKFKYEIGKKLPLDFYFPEVFFKPYPKIVTSPWRSRPYFYLIMAYFQKPLKVLKNSLGLNKKYGY